MIFTRIAEKINAYKKYFTEIISLSIPMMIGNLGQILIGATDVFIAAKHATNTLAAISIANSIMFTVIAMGFGLMSAVSIVVSNRRGNRKPTKKFLITILNYTMVMSTVFFVICLLLVPLVSRVGFDIVLVPMIKEYIFICAFSLFGMYLFICLKEFLLAYEIVHFPNILQAGAVILNFLLAWALVFGFGPIPSYGVIGLAVAALVVRTLMGLILLIYCSKLIRFNNPFDGPMIKQLIKIGSPLAIAMLLEFFGFNIITILVGREAGVLAAVQNIVLTIVSCAYMIPLAISSAIAIKVGYFNGARDFKEIKRYSISGTLISVVVMGLFALVLGFFPNQIFEIFSKDIQMMKIGVPILFVAALYLMFDGLQVSLTGILKGLKMTKTASAAVISGYWLFGIPLGFVLAYAFKMSLIGFWIGLAVSFLFMSAILLIILRIRFRIIKANYPDYAKIEEVK